MTFISEQHRVSPADAGFAWKTLSGWGRYPVRRAPESFPQSVPGVASFLEFPYLPRGQGRSYGDAGLPASGYAAVNSSFLDRFIAFDAATGILRAEAGVSLRDILRAFVPRGFFPPVTPGTMDVSLGGALASNVHGKNHHGAGSIERFVEELEVATPAGTFSCSPKENRELFLATLGGYGLTGFITRASLRLRPIASPWVRTLRLRAGNLDELFSLFARHDGSHEYSVAWLDALAGGKRMGRGILMLGDHAPQEDGNPTRKSQDSREGRTLNVPFPMPGFVLGRIPMALFNQAFYGFSPLEKSAREDFRPFFYPLDRIKNWNLLYGRAGFLQYQCMIPDPKGEQGIAEVLDFLARNGMGSFLSVLKRCGDDQVMLPFCRRGYTLALDIPMRGAATLKLLDQADEKVLRYGGRVYLTKDARLRPETFRAMYPEWRDWMRVVRRFNPEGRSRSAMSERLELWKES